MNIKNKLRLYFESFAWLYLTFISYIPIRFIRTMFLRFFGMKIGSSVIYGKFRIRMPSKITIGNGSVIGHYSSLDGRNGLSIGDNVNISSEVMIWTMDHDHNSSSFKTSGGPVRINNHVWVSTRAIILPGVELGEGSVVAAGAVVTKNVEKFTVVGGIPAKEIGKRNKDLKYSPLDSGALPFI